MEIHLGVASNVTAELVHYKLAQLVRNVLYRRGVMLNLFKN